MKTHQLIIGVLLGLCGTVVYAKPVLNHIMIIWGENSNYEKSIEQPYLHKLAQSNIEFTNFSAVTHPSEPNYVAFACGMVALDSDAVNAMSFPQKNVFDLLDAKGISWKEYEESMVTPGKDTKFYRSKHDFCINFISIQTSATRKAKIKSFQGNNPASYRELMSANPPVLCMVTPNMCNDGHDCGVGQFNTWLKSSSFFQDMLKSKYYKDGAIFITFDENEYEPGNRIYCVAVSAKAKSGEKVSEYFDHYSMLRSVEDNWELSPYLTKNDKSANSMLGVFTSTAKPHKKN